jgi:hypothetical protein
MVVKRQNYLNNKDLMKEIHKSKSSYSSYNKPEYADYDIIVKTIDDVLRNVDEGRLARADRLTKIAQAEYLLVNANASKSDVTVIGPEYVSPHDVVFRVMTWDHIPEAPAAKPKAAKGKKNKIIFDDVVEDLIITETEYDAAIPDILPPAPTKYIRVNFPPYHHYRLDENFVPELIGKSHWQGDLVTGKFSKDHGQITNKLALMFIKLCERYSTRSNWRGYCVDDQTEALTKRGWLGIDQINEDDTILSYSEGDLKWSSIKSIFRDEFDGKMHHLTSDVIDALVTPEHKFVTDRGLIKVNHILNTDTIILSGNYSQLELDENLSLALSKVAISSKASSISFGHNVTLSNLNGDQNQPTVDYKGMVWCPKTEYGCFMARRNNTIYLTGNTYVEEMRSQSLLQLTMVGLQFNEAMSNNPFAYFTRILQNSFCGVLNVEKKSQNIRDDILEANGLSPSFSRQMSGGGHISSDGGGHYEE